MTEKVTILEALQRLRDDLKRWCINNFNNKVSIDRKINGKELKDDITLSASDIGLTNVILIESFDSSTGVLNTRSYDYNS